MPAPIALVGGLVDWLPRSATWVGIVSGPLVVLGYLVGSLPVGYLLSRRRLRRQLDDPELDRTGTGRVADDDPLAMPGTVAAGAVTAAGALLVATVAWDVALAATPSSRFFGSVGIFSNQALGAWVSVALWTGMAAVVGHVAPVWNRFRGGSGVPPAGALLLVYAPLVFAVAAVAAATGYAVTRRLDVALAAALPTAVVAEYGAWLTDTQAAWGVTNGPELGLWTTVLAGVLAARNLRVA